MHSFGTLLSGSCRKQVQRKSRRVHSAVHPSVMAHQQASTVVTTVHLDVCHDPNALPEPAQGKDTFSICTYHLLDGAGAAPLLCA